MLLLTASVLLIIGFRLLRIFDQTLRTLDFLPLTSDGEAVPWSYTISLLRLNGRFLLISRFPADAHVRAQAFAATFTLSVTARFLLNFGLWTRDLVDTASLPLGFPIPFIVIGIFLRSRRASSRAAVPVPGRPQNVRLDRFISGPLRDGCAALHFDGRLRGTQL
jgi:hypothetical protein